MKIKDSKPQKKFALALSGIILGVAVGAIVFATIYWPNLSNTKASLLQEDETPEENLPVPSPEPIIENPTTAVDLETPPLGSNEAPVTIIEYSDYQCPFCRDFHTETFPKLEAEYINTGIVQYIHRDLPLPAHPQAMLAATAARCANEQNAFWPMNKILFELQNTWANTTDPDQKMTHLATILKLNTQTFADCLKTSDYPQKITTSTKAALQDNIRSTPTFFINTQKLVGNQPYTILQQAIEKELTPR